MQSKLLYLFTRTPLHVGAGASVGAIDQPIARERHTGFPIIPASALKGALADEWPGATATASARVATKKENDHLVIEAVGEAAWLFGSDTAQDDLAAAGALLFGEARLLAFPVRSARGSFAWITSPLLLRRAVRAGVFPSAVATKIGALPALAEGEALFAKGTLDFSPPGKASQIVLEEYTFARPAQNGELPAEIGGAFAALLADRVWTEVAQRLVILADGPMSHFATTACEVAQHVSISDQTGTAETGKLFNQENVPSETLFYATISATDSRLKSAAYAGRQITYQPPTPAGQSVAPPPITKAAAALTAADAHAAFQAKIDAARVFQFGGDASTGLGFCTVKLDQIQGT